MKSNFSKNNSSNLKKKFHIEELPREKLIKYGAENLTNIELFAILLRTGYKNKNVIELSRDILTKYSLKQIANKSFYQLIQIKGINKVKATQIISLFELQKRLNKDTNFKKIQLKNSNDVYNFSKPYLNHLETENLMVIFVNSKNQIIEYKIFKGGIDNIFIDLKLLIKEIINLNCNGIFLVHNHPSKDQTPSENDINFTKKIKNSLQLLEIRLIDHIIIGENYFSFFENNLL